LEKASEEEEAARVETCFALFASVEDTNLLHRGGLDGLRFAQRATRRFLDAQTPLPGMDF
jgi:triphosphoribosyl-dephospho-CoA synthase